MWFVCCGDVWAGWEAVPGWEESMTVWSKGFCVAGDFGWKWFHENVQVQILRPRLSHKGIWDFYNGTTHSSHQVTSTTLGSKLLLCKQCRHLGGRLGMHTSTLCRWPSYHWLPAILAGCVVEPIDSWHGSLAGYAWVEHNPGDNMGGTLPLPALLQCLRACFVCLLEGDWTLIECNSRRWIYGSHKYLMRF